METEVTLNSREVMAKLSKLQEDIDYIKLHIDDIMLTDDDRKSLLKAEKEYKEGKTTSLSTIKKELGI